MKVRSRCREGRINNGLIIQQGQAIDRSRQVGVSKPEVGAKVPVSRQAQAQAQGQGHAERSGRLRVRTGEGQNQEGEKKRDDGTRDAAAFCLLEINVLCAKSANQSQNNSKGPCEVAIGNRYKSIYIHSKTSPILT
jgi:hypothetical protein